MVYLQIFGFYAVKYVVVTTGFPNNADPAPPPPPPPHHPTTTTTTIPSVPKTCVPQVKKDRKKTKNMWTILIKCYVVKALKWENGAITFTDFDEAWHDVPT